MRQENKRNKEISIVGLFGEKRLGELQEKLAEATDFSFSIIDYRGGEIVPPHFHRDYADYLRKHGEDQSCQLSSAFAAAKAAITNLPYIYLCQCGLVKAAIPIIVHEQYLGAIICGYIRCNDPDETDPATGEPVIHKDFQADDTKEYSEDLKKIPSYPAGKIAGIAGLVFYLMQEMSAKEEYIIRMDKDEHNQVHLKELRKKNKELTEAIRTLEWDNEKKDIYPQALINMLVTVSNFAILEDANKTANVIESLSSILRYYLGHGRETVSLNKEMVQMEKYLEVIREQYENRLKVVVERKGITKDQKVPKLALFSLLNYLLSYTVPSSDYRGTLTARAEYVKDRCMITLRFDHEGTEEQSEFLQNFSDMLMDEKDYLEQITVIEKRLDRICKGDYHLSVQRNLITLDLPKETGNM